MNMNKLKVRLNRHAGRTDFTLGNDMLEQVHEFNHLGGQVVSAAPSSEGSTSHRMSTGWDALRQHFQITNSKLP